MIRRLPALDLARVCVLGADQKKSGLWGQDCTSHLVDSSPTSQSMNVSKITSILIESGCTNGWHDLPSQQQ